MPFWELTPVGPRNHVLHEVQTPKGNGQFWGLSTPLKSTDSLRCSVFKNSWTDRDAIWDLTRVGQRNHLLDGGQGRTNSFATARGDNMVTWPFIKILLPLVGQDIQPTALKTTDEQY